MKHRAFITIAAMVTFGAVAQPDPWAALRSFVGKWEGPTTGKPGKGSTSREYQFVLNDHFLSQRDKSVYQPDDRTAKPTVHEDFGFFSYDTSIRKVVWRQFHSEGFVNEYVLQTVSSDGKSLEFITTRIENLPGFRAKKTYRIISQDEIEETFFLSPPGQDFDVYTTALLKRAK